MSTRKAPPPPDPHDDAHDPDEFLLTLLVRFFQGAFNVRDDKYHWEPVPSQTGILITASTPIDREVLGKLPAIVVVPGPFQAVPIGIGDVAGSRISTSVTCYHYLNTGYYAVYTLGTTPAEATKLARECERVLLAERSLLEGRGGFHQIARPGCAINPPSAPGELVPGDAEGPYMVQMSVPAYWQYTVRVTPTLDSPHRRSISQIMGRTRARENEYQGIDRLQQVVLRIGEQDRVVRVLQGSVPGTVRIQPSERTLARMSVLPRLPDEE